MTRTQFDYLGDCVAAWNVARVDAEEYPILKPVKPESMVSVSGKRRIKYHSLLIL